MLVALAASLFALIASAHAQDLCGSDTIGKPIDWSSGMVKQLPTVNMPAGSQELTIDIPDNVCAPAGMIGSVPGGVSLKVCDYVAPPIVRLTTLKHAVVSRASNTAPGVVYTTVQCVPSGLGSSG
ncbi:hypothetical protein ABMA28_013183 [Loxostege sticticalis]|uniref:Uncharacterized protein n=1 Tax=Loxostege sticticalis TaxID=481309 RepID=A0ABD0THD4_LOXSC